jgi:hypothetical protein
MVKTPQEVVDVQLAAFNAHDIDAFMATHSPTIQSMDFPSNKLYEDGAEAFRLSFLKYFEEQQPHVEIAKRIVRGNFVIDHEMGKSKRGGEYVNWEAVAIYEVVDELIQRVWIVVNDKAASE